MVELALRAQFHRARALWLGLALTRDFAASLAFLFASALLSFHLDRRLVLSPTARLAWGTGTLLLAAGFAAVGAWRAFRRRPDDRAVAVGMERRHPELRERLLSAVELGRLPEAERQRFSPELLAAVQSEAEAAAGGLDFRRAVTWREALPSVLACGILSGVALLHLAVAPAAVAAWWGRMLWPGADIPVYRATRVRISPRDTLLLRGGDLPITVRTEGQAVDRAVLHFRVGGGSWSAVTLRAPYRHRLQGLTETAVYYATAGDGTSDRGTARVVDPPALVGLRLSYHFPAYMARPDQTVSGVSGTLSLPAGTRVELALTASQPLESAAMTVAGRSEALRTDGAAGAGAFTLWSDTPLQVRLRDTNGFMGAAPAGIQFHALPDQAPAVRIEQPATDQDVVADASVPLHVSAADDHGLDHLRIAHWPSAPAARPASLPLAEGTRSQRSLDVRARWNLGSLSLHPGDVVVYRAEADDWDDLRGPHTGQTAEQRLRVIDRAEMERRLAEGWAEWNQQLGAAILEQRATRGAVQAARAPADLAEAERRQRDLSPRAEDLARRAAELAEMARTNHLAAEATIARQEQAGGELAAIARGPMPEAADRIRESSARPALLAQAEALQSEIERRLAALRRQARAETDLEALARRAEELARAQAELQGQSQHLLPETLGLNLRELGAGPQGALTRISHSQTALQQTTGQFEATLDRAAQGGPEPAVAASRRMRQRAIPERQSQAATQVSGNLLARAAAGQQALAADLREIAALLRQPPAAARPDAAAGQQQAAARAARALDRLLQQHAAVMRRTAGHPNAAESRRLARQERALREQAARMAEQLRRAGVSSQSMQSAAQRMAQAARQLERAAPRQAQPPQAQAQQSLQAMAQQLQDQLGGQQAEAARERLRQDLQNLAQRQAAIGKALQRGASRPNSSAAAKQLAPRQDAAARSAQNMAKRMPSETFRSAMAQAESAMRRAGASLRQGDTGTQPQSASRQAERLLQEMARAMEQPGSSSSSSSQNSGSSNRAGQPSAQELARRLADLRLLRSMEQGLRDETGEASRQPEGQEQRLRDLARRQAQNRGATARLGEQLQRFPGSGRRVGEAAGAMGQAQRGLQGGSAGAETQGAQATAIMRLTQAIGQGQQQLQAMAAAGARGGRQSAQRAPGAHGQQPGARGQQPALDSIAVHGTDDGGPRSLVPTGRRGFGLLSPGDQQALREGAREKVPADFADLIHRYYRALSERSR